MYRLHLYMVDQMYATLCVAMNYSLSVSKRFTVFYLPCAAQHYTRKLLIRARKYKPTGTAPFEGTTLYGMTSNRDFR